MANKTQKMTAQELGLKAKAWTFVGYPSFVESSNFSGIEEYAEYISKSGTVFAYIKHLPDVDEKKEHYHFMVVFDGPTTRRCISSQFSAILANRNNAANIQPVKSISGMCRYMLHLDNPEKTQYKEEDVKQFNGFCLDTEPLMQDKKRDDYYEMWRLLKEWECVNFTEFLDLLVATDEREIIKTATRNCFAIKTYLKETRG